MAILLLRETNVYSRKGNGMRTFQLIYLAFIWIVPTLLSWYSFTKMMEDERQEIVKEIKKPLFIFSIAPLVIGFLVFLSGSVLALGLKVVQHFGIGLVFFGWLVMWLVNLISKEKSMTKSLFMIIAGAFGVIIYIYLI